MPIEVEDDPFFQLLTDALRAGPASPPWREAVAKLRDGTATAGADEYRMLIEARENLEVGRSYREVRPGPNFTRKVLTSVAAERQSVGGRRLPIAGIVTVLALIVLVGVVGYVAHLITGGATSTGAVEELVGTYFSTTVISADFDSYVLSGARDIGKLPLGAPGGLHLVKGMASADGALGGGLVLPQPVPADSPFATEAHVRPGGSGDQLVELFISTSEDFSEDRATAPHELVWLIRGQSQQVVRDGEVVIDKPVSHIPGQPTLEVRMIMNKDLAVVEVDHQRLWSGAHGLGEGPRFPGVRILTTAPGVVGNPLEPAIMDWKVVK